MEKNRNSLAGARIALQVVEMALSLTLAVLLGREIGFYINNHGPADEISPRVWFLFAWSIVGWVVVTVAFILTLVHTFSSANVFTGKAEGITQTVLSAGWLAGAIVAAILFGNSWIAYVVIYWVTFASTVGSAIVSFVDAKGGTKLANEIIEEEL